MKYYTITTVHLATWLACTAPGPPQESLVCKDIPTSQALPNPDDTRPIGPPGRGRLRQSANPESLVAHREAPVFIS